MIKMLLKLALLLVSYFGWWEYFRKRHRIPVYFTPLFTIACHFCVLFAAGILNYLKDAAILLWCGGLLLAANAAFKEKDKVLKPYLTGGYLFCAVLFAAVTLYTRNQGFFQIDNFTHWATVVRNMLSTDRFPNQLDTAVEFTSYPLEARQLSIIFAE